MSTARQPQRRGGMGLRSALQHAQQAAELAQTALRLPALHSSKPLLLLTQLHPLLLLLGVGDGNGSDSDSNSPRSSTATPHTPPHLAAAARQLRRLAAVDGQGLANECLLFWMLAVLAWRGLDRGEVSAGEGSVGVGKLHSNCGGDRGRRGSSRDSISSGSDDSFNSSGEDEENEGSPGEQRGDKQQGGGGADSEPQVLPQDCGEPADTAVWLRWRLAPGHFLKLVGAMGWGELLRAALPSRPGWAQRLLPHCPGGAPLLQRLLIGDVAAQAALHMEGAAGWQENAQAAGPAGAGAQRLARVGRLAWELEADLDLLLEGLVEWQADGHMDGQQGAQLQSLSAAADTCFGILLPLTQQPGWSQAHQRLFQQLCQLRARLALLQLAAAGAHPADTAEGAARAAAEAAVIASGSPRSAQRGGGPTAGWDWTSAGASDAWEAWRAVLETSQGPTTLQAAGQGQGIPAEQQQHTNRSSSSSSSRGGTSPSTSSPVFLAAQAAAWRLLGGGPQTSGWDHPRESLAPPPAAAQGEAEVRLQHSQGAPTTPALPRPPSRPQQPPSVGFVTHVDALPGVSFSPPALLTPVAPGSPEPGQAQALRLWHSVPKTGPGDGVWENKGPLQGKPLSPLAGDPNPLSPAGLVLASLELAQQQLSLGAAPQDQLGDASASVSRASTTANGMDGAVPAKPPAGHDSSAAVSGEQWDAGTAGAAAARTLLWLAAGAAAQVDSRQQQRALLRCVLRTEGWLGRLRQAADGDAALQEWCRRGLLALSNRMADTSAAVQVFGDERQRVSALARELLPFALLAPAATVERLLTDAITHSGQAATVVEVLVELPPLAFYSRPSSPATTYLEDCLCACLADPLAAQPPTSGNQGGTNGAPPPQQLFQPALSLLTSPAHSKALIRLAVQLCSTRAAEGGKLLVHPGGLLQRAVLPTLQPQHVAGGRPHLALPLALELAYALLGCGSPGQQAAAGASRTVQPLPRSGADVAWLLLGGLEDTPPALPSPPGAPGSGNGGPGDSSIKGSFSEGGSRGDTLAVQLLAPLLRLLDFDSRQLSASPAALLTSLECYGLARDLVQRIVGVLAAAASSPSPSPSSLAAAASVAIAAKGGGSFDSQGELARRAGAIVAPLLDLGLPDAWLFLGHLLAEAAAGQEAPKQLQLPQPSPPLPLQPPQQKPAGQGAEGQLLGQAAAARLLQLCAADEATATWAAEQAEQGCWGLQEASAAATSPTLLPPQQQQEQQQTRQLHGPFLLPAAMGQLAGGASAHAAQLALATQQLPLPEARRALVAACVATLPVCTPGEAGRVLGGGLLLAVAAVVRGQGPQQPQRVQHGAQHAQRAAALQASVLEVACRALSMLALSPTSCPLAGEQQQAVAGGVRQEGSPLGSGGGKEGPSQLRRVAVERVMRHVSAYCQGATSCPPSPASSSAVGAVGTAIRGCSSGAQGPLAAGAGAEQAQAHAPAEVTPCTEAMHALSPGSREACAPPMAATQAAAAAAAAAALAVRAFQEVCRVAAALQPFYPCATLQICLLHLVQVLRGHEGGRLQAATVNKLRESASRLEGQLGETVRFALEELEAFPEGEEQWRA